MSKPLSKPELPASYVLDLLIASLPKIPTRDTHPNKGPVK